MQDETTITVKESSTKDGSVPFTNGSSIGGVSVRAWIVLIIVMSVCGNWMFNTVLFSLGYTSNNMVVPEPIYSVFIAVISYYFGQIKK